MGGKLAIGDKKKEQKINRDNPIYSMLVVGLTFKVWQNYAIKVGKKIKAAEENGIDYVSSDSQGDGSYLGQEEYPENLYDNYDEDDENLYEDGPKQNRLEQERDEIVYEKDSRHNKGSQETFDIQRKANLKQEEARTLESIKIKLKYDSQHILRLNEAHRKEGKEIRSILKTSPHDT